MRKTSSDMPIVWNDYLFHLILQTRMTVVNVCGFGHSPVHLGGKSPELEAPLMKWDNLYDNRRNSAIIIVSSSMYLCSSLIL